MSAQRRTDLALRLELLRLRGELQRAEAAAALTEVRSAARRTRDAFSVLAGAVRAVSGARARAFDSGSIALLSAALRDRPWLVPLAGLTLKLVRRHPRAALAVATAALVARWLLRPAQARAPLGEAGTGAVERPTSARPDL